MEASDPTRTLQATHGGTHNSGGDHEPGILPEAVSHEGDGHMEDEGSSSDCGCHHDHSPAPRANVFGGVEDPSNLSTVPREFYSNPQFENRPFLRDPDELKYIRCVVASFFNYRVDQTQPRMMLLETWRSLRGISSE